MICLFKNKVFKYIFIRTPEVEIYQFRIFPESFKQTYRKQHISISEIITIGNENWQKFRPPLENVSEKKRKSHRKGYRHRNKRTKAIGKLDRSSNPSHEEILIPRMCPTFVFPLSTIVYPAMSHFSILATIFRFGIRRSRNQDGIGGMISRGLGKNRKAVLLHLCNRQSEKCSLTDSDV